ncbi:MAG TPA: peptide chain release factor N(5)-glutamine methyltransferase [Bacteroidia bacterium]|nr:peptide chain release factor N(5)-glutamine methyltransferase [Bacteroidia bacterium]
MKKIKNIIIKPILHHTEETTLSDIKAEFWCALIDSGWPEEEADSVRQLVFTEKLNISPLFLHIYKKHKLSAELVADLDSILKRLLKNEPVQYILGYTWFYGQKFKVTPHTLIPRRETEELVDLVAKQNLHECPVILDIGTGSGCIAIMLKQMLKKCSVWALDISAGALETAMQNAKLILEESKRVHFVPGDILSEKTRSQLGMFDIIVSNPPYVTKSEKNAMQPNVLNYEPSTALFVPDNNPLLFYEAITTFAQQHLNPGGKLYFEINEQFGREVKQMLKNFGFNLIEIRKDMQGKDRMVSAVWPGGHKNG